MATEKAAPAAIEDDEDNLFTADEANEPKLEAKDIIVEAKGKPEPEPELDPEPVDPGVAELKRQLETREAELRDRNAQLNAERDQRLQAERQSGAISVAMVDQAMDAAKNYRGQLRSQFIAAQTAGNYEATADIQIAISQNEANLLSLQQQRMQIESYNAQPQQSRQTPQQEMAGPDRIAKNLSDGGFQKSADWIRTNRSLVADQRGINRVEAAHKYAVEIKGLIPETPEYFARLEEELGIRQAESQAEPEAVPVRVVRPAAAAPVSSRTPGLGGRDTGRQTIRLNAAQVEAAGYLGMTLQEYAASIADPAVQKRLIGTR